MRYDHRAATLRERRFPRIDPQRDPHASGFSWRRADQFSVHQLELAGFIGQPLELRRRYQRRDRAHGIHHLLLSSELPLMAMGRGIFRDRSLRWALFPSRISQWERGEKHPRAASLKRLAVLAKNGPQAVA